MLSRKVLGLTKPKDIKQNPSAIILHNVAVYSSLDIQLNDHICNQYEYWFKNMVYQPGMTIHLSKDYPVT